MDVSKIILGMRREKEKRRFGERKPKKKKKNNKRPSRTMSHSRMGCCLDAWIADLTEVYTPLDN